MRAKFVIAIAMCTALLPLIVTAQAQAALRPVASRAHVVAHATACIKYKVAGKWLFVATNDYRTTAIITQHGNKLSGPMTIPANEAVNSGYSLGHFTGTVVGKRFRIIVIWAPRASDGVQLHGLYTGTVTTKHIVNGLATDLTTKPTPSPAAWVGYGPTVCTAHAA
jgi:hypothetical protein